MSVKRSEADILRAIAARGGGGRGAYYSLIRDMKQFERRAYLTDKSAAGARWQNTEYQR